MKHNVAIDRLRGFSVLAVVCMHYHFFFPPVQIIPVTALRNGYYGVTAFFCISGFLITTTILNRYNQVAKVDLYAFYVRRFGRIAPPLILLLLTLSLLSTTAIHFFVFPPSLSLKDSLLSAFTFRYNLYYQLGGSQMGVWAILWSLSIEEMFYLVYPLTAKVTKYTSRLAIILVAVVAYAPVYRLRDSLTLYDYFGCFDGIALGALSALAAKRFSRQMNGTASWGIMVAGISLLAWTYTRVDIFAHYNSGLTLIAAGAALSLFASQCAPFAGTRPRAYDPLVYLGRLSYEIYLFHMTIFALLSIVILPRFAGHPVLVFAAVMLCVVAAGDIVARLYAEPFNGWLRATLLPTRKAPAPLTASIQPSTLVSGRPDANFARLLVAQPARAVYNPPKMKSTRLFLALLVVAQFGLFWQYAKREVVWAYPGGFDQTAYLTLDDGLYRDMLQTGPFPAIARYLHQSPPTGIMLPLQDGILHFFGGPGRMTNLSLNFVYFVLLEIVFFETARWLSGRAVFGWIGVGLLMLQQTGFLGAGGLFDCRIDYIVYSLYGIFVCLLVRSDGLREKRWLAAAVGCALLLVSFRFITFSYLLGFCATLFTVLLGLRLVWKRRRRERVTLKLALWRTMALGSVFLLVGGAMIFLNWRAIHDYYVVGHLTGNEKHVRAAEMGIKDLTGHFTFYFIALFREHFGPTFIFAWLALAALGLDNWFSSRRNANFSPGQFVPRSKWLVELSIICASIFAPWFILTLDESKSALVAGALAPPAALLLISLATGFARRRRRSRSAAAVGVWRDLAGWRVAAAAVVGLGVVNWMDHLAREGPYSARRASVEQIGALYDFLGAQSTLRGLKEPRFATDIMFDWNIPGAVNVSLYERTGQWLAAHPAFGYSIFAMSREQMLAELATADIAMMSTFPKVGPYPFSDSIRPLEGDITAWCDTHLQRTRVFDIYDQHVTVYFRLQVQWEGLSGDWLTPTGVRLHIPAGVLETMRAGGKNSLVLAGPVNPSWLKQAPTASAQLLGPDDTLKDTLCPVEFTLPTPESFRIRLDLSAMLLTLPPAAEAVVALRFEGASFYPPDVGINDPRHLIVNRPTTVQVE